MENIELQKIWKSIDHNINLRPKEELELLLSSKAKQTINNFLKIVVLSVISATGLFVWIIIATINRSNDLLYVLNNIILGIVALTALISGILYWHRLHNYKHDLALKNWLELRIKLLSKNINRRNISFFFIPIYILCVLSIHVYFEYKPFLDVFKSEESVYGLIFGLPIGFIAGYYISVKIRKYQIKNLSFLKDLYGRLCCL